MHFAARDLAWLRILRNLSFYWFVRFILPNIGAPTLRKSLKKWFYINSEFLLTANDFPRSEKKVVVF